MSYYNISRVSYTNCFHHFQQFNISLYNTLPIIQYFTNDNVYKNVKLYSIPRTITIIKKKKKTNKLTHIIHIKTYDALNIVKHKHISYTKNAHTL